MRMRALHVPRSTCACRRSTSSTLLKTNRTRFELYAERRGFQIVRTYADEGRSGLRLAGRDALTRLIADVESGKADFSAILVYDVSRWGRFQDADESAYYEQICKRARISVHYCAEQFENDGSPVSTIINRNSPGPSISATTPGCNFGSIRLISM